MKHIFLLIALCALIWNASPLLSAPTELETAQELLTQGRIPDAYQSIQSHIRLHPGDPHGAFLKAVILERLGRFSEAMDVYRDLIERHPELPEPYNNLAGLLAAAGQFDEAKATLQAALETHPSYATAHQNLSRIYSAMASSAYRRVLGKEDERILVHLDPLEELFDTPAGPLPAASMYVAAIDPRGPDARGEHPGHLPSPTPPVPDPEPGAAAPETTSQTASRPEPGIETAVQASPDPVREPAPEPVPEPAAPQPTAPEPVVVPAPEPAPPPPTPSTPSVPPLPEPPAPRPGPDAVKETITDVVLSWAKAWESQNVEAYLSFYSGNFRPEGGLTLAQWRDQRRSRVAAPPFINVTLSNIVVVMQDRNAAQVHFAQRYRSNVINDQVSKELQLRKENGQWLIVRERLLPRS